MSLSKPIQLGLCCINTILRAEKPPIFSSRKMIVKTVKEKGINELKKLIIKNLEDTLVLMDWNENNGIKVFRLSSELFPHKTNKLVEDYTFDFAIDLLKEIGRIAKIYGQRLTFHPGQYNVVGSPNRQCYEQTCIELKYHADILDLMELDDNSVMVVHGGGTYGDKRATIDRWCYQFTLLPENVKRRLVLENCEKSFSIIDCLEISERINIPVVFDTHHFECYKKLHPKEEHLFEEPVNYIERILNTWKRRGIKPKFHVSEQGCGKTGHHSDYINEIPQYLLEIPERYNVHIDIMIEAKMKEQSILRLYEKYPELNCKMKPIKIKVKLNKIKHNIKSIKEESMEIISKFNNLCINEKENQKNNEIEKSDKKINNNISKTNKYNIRNTYIEQVVMNELNILGVETKTLRTEDLGKIFEMAICLLYGATYVGNFKYSLKKAYDIKDRLIGLLKVFPYILKHIARNQNRYDFECVGYEHIKLSAKTTKKNGKICPQVIGQPTKKTFCEFFNVDKSYDLNQIKIYIENNVSYMLEKYISTTFDCPILYYNEYKNLVLLIKLKENINWEKCNINFSHKIKNKVWNESSSIIVNGISIGEFQVHNHRNCIKFRWILEKLLDLFKDNFEIIHI